MLNQVILNVLDTILISNFNDLLPKNLLFLIRGATEQVNSRSWTIILLLRFRMSLQLWIAVHKATKWINTYGLMLLYLKIQCYNLDYQGLCLEAGQINCGHCPLSRNKHEIEEVVCGNVRSRIAANWICKFIFKPEDSIQTDYIWFETSF